MKKSKSIPVRESYCLVPQPYRVAHEMSIVLLVGVAFALGSCFVTLVSRKAHASPPNLVMVPEYSESRANDVESDDSPQPGLKVQYEPATDEKPILHKKGQKEEIAGGAEYIDGDELVVEAESDDLAVSAVPIIERDLSDAVPRPSPSPSPGSHQIQQRDFGRRTADGR